VGAAHLFFSPTAFAQQDIASLKVQCDAYGFNRGTPEHADCVRKLDMRRVQMQCQALIQRGHQVCSKEYADLISPVAMAADCSEVQSEYQQECQ